MTEELLFESGNCKVTPARVVAGGATYAVANITSVKAMTDNSWQLAGTVPCVLGVIACILGTALSISLGVLLLGVGGALIAFGSRTEVVIMTGAAENVAFVSRDEDKALALASAINLAIVKRGIR